MFDLLLEQEEEVSRIERWRGATAGRRQWGGPLGGLGQGSDTFSCAWARHAGAWGRGTHLAQPAPMARFQKHLPFQTNTFPQACPGNDGKALSAFVELIINLDGWPAIGGDTPAGGLDLRAEEPM